MVVEMGFLWGEMEYFVGMCAGVLSFLFKFTRYSINGLRLVDRGAAWMDVMINLKCKGLWILVCQGG